MRSSPGAGRPAAGLLSYGAILCSTLSCEIFLLLLSLDQQVKSVFSLYSGICLYKTGLKGEGEIPKTIHTLHWSFEKKNVWKLLRQGPQIVVYLTSKVFIGLSVCRSKSTSCGFNSLKKKFFGEPKKEEGTLEGNLKGVT